LRRFWQRRRHLISKDEFGELFDVHRFDRSLWAGFRPAVRSDASSLADSVLSKDG
jgi:hypothetical protein